MSKKYVPKGSQQQPAQEEQRQVRQVSYKPQEEPKYKPKQKQVYVKKQQPTEQQQESKGEQQQQQFEQTYQDSQNFYPPAYNQQQQYYDQQYQQYGPEEYYGQEDYYGEQYDQYGYEQYPPQNEPYYQDNFQGYNNNYQQDQNQQPQRRVYAEQPPPLKPQSTRDIESRVTFDNSHQQKQQCRYGTNCRNKNTTCKWSHPDDTPIERNRQVINQTESVKPQWEKQESQNQFQKRQDPTQKNYEKQQQRPKTAQPPTDKAHGQQRGKNECSYGAACKYKTTTCKKSHPEAAPIEKSQQKFQRKFEEQDQRPKTTNQSQDQQKLTVQERFDEENNQIKQGERMPTFTIEKRDQRDKKPEKPKREKPLAPKKDRVQEDFPKIDEKEESKSQQSMEEETDPSTQIDEEYKEEDEELFLEQMMKNPGASKNQVSKENYAFGEKRESVKSKPTVLMVAEKPSIAQAIAEALSHNKCTKGGGKMPVYTFNTNFKGHNCLVKVTSVAGHVFNRDFPSKFQDRRADPEILFDAPTLRKLEKQSRGVANHLQAQSRGIDFLVLWLDCDKEGENICFEVLDIVGKNIPRSRMQRVYRAKFSSIAQKDLINAFNNLRDRPNFDEAVSVDARQVIDLKLGVAFSRYQTKEFAQLIRSKGGEKKTISYGPCQTPTLGFCVDQAEKIKKFIPEPYWKIQLTVKAKSGDEAILKWLRGKIYDQQVVKAIHERMGNVQEAKVMDVKKQRTHKARPVGINTVYLLKKMSSSFGFSAQETMHIAERLYLSGYTTYPRTESTDFSPNFDFKEVIQEHVNHPEWGNFAARLLKEGHNRPKKGIDAGDHPPITPVKAAMQSWLSSAEWKVYSFITRSFLGCISTDATYDAVAAVFESAGETFKLQGKVLITPGFLEVMTWHTSADQIIPDFKPGDIVKVVGNKLTEGITQAPGYLTEANLIAKMEKHGIGTDASIATHIKNIIDRNYVQVRDPGRQLVPTPLGYALCKGYCEIDPELVLPQVRQNIEKSCEMIAKGRADYNRVIAHVTNIFLAKFKFFKLSKGVLEKLLTIMRMNENPNQNRELLLSYKIAAKFAEPDNAINFCIKCFQGHFCVEYHSSKKWGIKCSKCNFRISLLQGAGQIHVNQKNKCKECQSNCAEVQYKENSPFPGGAKSRVGCLLCDPAMRSTITNFFFKQQRQKTKQELEEDQRRKEEQQKLKEEKRQKREAEEKEKLAQGILPQEGEKKKKNKKKSQGPNILSAEDKIREFNRKLHHQDGDQI